MNFRKNIDKYQAPDFLAWQLLRLKVKIKNVLLWGFAPTFGLAFLLGRSEGVYRER